MPRDNHPDSRRHLDVTSPFPDADTIYALSTPYGRSAIAAIRISSPHIASLEQITTAICRRPLADFIPRQATLCLLYEANKPTSQQPIDQVLAIYFPPPNSFTGEAMLEIFPHGGTAIIDDILSCLATLPDHLAALPTNLNNGSTIRQANPGEFTQRAFLNGKLDLIAAEALNAAIEAETTEQRKLAQQQLNLTRESSPYHRWRQEMVEAMAQIEAFIDFPDDDIPHDILTKTAASITQIKAELTAHLATSALSKSLMDGVRVAIIGQPNAGKSSLLNLVAADDVAIVSSIAGTTRDTLNQRLNLGGFLVILTDTAGLRNDPNDPIEAEGIERSRKAAQNADILLILLDSTQPLSPQLDAITSMLLLPLPRVILLNKVDCLQPDAAADTSTTTTLPSLLAELEDHLTQRRLAWEDGAILPFSALPPAAHHTYLPRLLSLLQQHLAAIIPADRAPMPLNHRQRTCLAACITHLAAFSLEQPLDIAAQELRFAAAEMGRLLGVIGVEEILDSVFANFCIGK